MNITEVRVKLVGNQSERVQAFCSVTLDHDFVIRDLKVIEGTNGLFVAMPSRKLADHCPGCRGKNHMRARFCNHCGARLDENRAGRDAKGRKKLHADVAHPINADCRQMLQSAVVEAFGAEVEQSKTPGYVPTALDDDDDFEVSSYTDLVDDLKQSMGSKRGRNDNTRGESRRRAEKDEPAPADAASEDPAEPVAQRAELEERAAFADSPVPSSPDPTAHTGATQNTPEPTDGFGAGIL